MMVPKHIHRVWLGGERMPAKFRKYGRTWRDLHPEWEIHLWTEKNLPKLINQKSLKACNNYSEMSDLIRYELLYIYGGVYIDVDFECFKNIEPLINNISLFVSTEDNKHICGGFIGSIPRHPVIKRVIDQIPKKLENTKNNTADLRIGPTFLTETIDENEIVILPKKFFYPYLPGQEGKKKRLNKNNVAYAAHHWAASWLNNK